MPDQEGWRSVSERSPQACVLRPLPPGAWAADRTSAGAGWGAPTCPGEDLVLGRQRLTLWTLQEAWPHCHPPSGPGGGGSLDSIVPQWHTFRPSPKGATWILGLFSVLLKTSAPLELLVCPLAGQVANCPPPHRLPYHPFA